MNIQLLLSALRARQRLFLLILAATVLTTLGISLMMQKTYVAKVSVLLDGRDDQSLRAATNGPQERDRVGYLQTQVDILTSPRVARRVAADLKLGENPTFRAKFEEQERPGTIEDWLAEAMLQRLKVDTSQSSILQVSYASAEPEMAAAIANAFAKAYVDTVLELRVDPSRQTSAWFNDQLKELRENMEQAQQRLAQFQRDNGILYADERLEVESIQLAELANQVAKSRDLGYRGPNGNGFLEPEVQSAPGVSGLRAELLRSEARLNQLSADLGPRHPQYVRQAAEVQALRARIDSASRVAANGANEAAERNRMRREALQNELQAQRERVLKLKDARTQMAALSYDASVAQRIYETAMQSFMTSNIDSRAMQTNVRILNPALPPAKPAKPKILLNLALSVVIGTLLGLAVVYVLELLDQRVRILDDLEWDPNVPVLTVLNSWNPAANRLPYYPGSRPALPGPGYPS